MRDESVRSTKGHEGHQGRWRIVKGWLKRTGIRRGKNTGRGLHRRKKKKKKQATSSAPHIRWFGNQGDGETNLAKPRQKPKTTRNA